LKDLLDNEENLQQPQIIREALNLALLAVGDFRQSEKILKELREKMGKTRLEMDLRFVTKTFKNQRFNGADGYLFCPPSNHC